jgi:hypothetical protein
MISLITDRGSKLRPADGALLRCFLIAFRAVETEAHMPAGGKENICRTGEADRALLPGIALEEVIRAVDILKVEGEAAPLDST